jgi:hypothetical protein
VRVVDPYAASYGVSDPIWAVTQLAQTTMRSELGKYSLDRTFSERESLNSAIVAAINSAAATWGISCLRYEIRDINPPASLPQAMSLQAEAERWRKVAENATAEVQRRVDPEEYRRDLIDRIRVALDLNPSQIRERTFALVLDQFERLAEVAPLLLIVEDLHWLDPTSFDLLDRIIPRLRDRRVLLVMTCRDGEQEEWIARSELEVLRQGRLSPEHSKAIVRNVLGDRHLDPAFQAQIVSKTDGIPLFLEEFTSTVVDAVESARGLDRFATPAMPRSMARGEKGVTLVASTER